MPSPEVLDFERLLAPIPGENPAGIALREDYSPRSAYHALKDARAKARAAERNVVWGDEAPDLRGEWRPVLELAPKILTEQSKDLEVTAWLIEALVRFDGYAGLRDGFRLARELSERFWDFLYPMPDEDGLLTRVAPLAGLNGEEAEGTLINPMFSVPITGEGGDRRFTISDHRQACDVERTADPDKRAQRIAQGAVSLEVFERAVAVTPAAFFRNLLDDLQQCAEEFGRLAAALEERCGRDIAPPTSNIRNALETCLETVKGVSQHVLAAAEADAQPGSDGALTPVDGASGRAPMRVSTREDAFRALLQVADFFKRTEPHSPVSYALEQAVRWGRMPLPELMAELIPDDATRRQLYKLVGIREAEKTQ
jgi:type VI secretion system protein ImpA